MMLSLESDEMTDMWPNEKLTLTFYETFLNGTSFKEFFFDFMLSLESDEMTALLQNEN